jgi:hypothetical protein
MRMLLLAAAGLALAGCTTTNFLGSGTPCEKASYVHAAFVTVAATTSQIPASARRGERALYAGVAAACTSGSDLNNVNLAQLVNAYVAAVEEYKR